MRFYIPGQPIGKARPRKGKYGVYNPTENTIYEKKIRDAYINAMGMIPEPMAGPIWMNVELVYAIPKGTSKVKREMMHDLLIRPLIKPDIDNCLKIIMDALNKTAYYDDKQIVEIGCTKRYGENPGMIIHIGRKHE